MGQPFEHGCHVAAHVEQAPHFVNPFDGEQDLLLEDVDSIEVLGVSRRALEMFRLPDWKAEDADFRADEMRRYAMTGFLGDEDDDDSADGIDAGDIAAGEDNDGGPDIR